MTFNPPTQYADDRNLRARQRLWESQDPPFDLIGWVLDLAGVTPGGRVLDVGCGNGHYLPAVAARGATAVGADLSAGMLRGTKHALPDPPPLVQGDVAALPVAAASFDVVLAPHMLYHVPDRRAAAAELRRVLRPGGVCVAVTNGAGHLRSLNALIQAAGRDSTPGWEYGVDAVRAFSLENGAGQLEEAFDSVTCVRPEGVAPARVTDASIIADYAASVADVHAAGVAAPWSTLVERVRQEVQAVIDRDGAWTVAGDPGAFLCR